MDWVEVTDDNAIKTLMSDFGGFHDSCIVSISYNSGNYVNEEGAMCCGDSDEHTVSMILHSQWRNRLELCFSGVRRLSVTGFRERYFCEILGALLEFRTDLQGKTRDEKLIVWADWESFDPLTYVDKYPLGNGSEVTYIIAERLKYRFLES